MTEIYIALFFLVLGFALDQIIFPRTKTVNVADDYIESNKVKDQSKIKIKKPIFGFLKRDTEKKKAKQIERDLRKSK